MSNLPQGQGNQEIARRRTFTYAAQEIPKIDVEIVAKGHLWMEINQIPSQLQVYNGIELARIFHESTIATADSLQ